MRTEIKNMKKKHSYRYNKWISHYNNTKDRVNYSIRRMDLLIITISGAGIYIIFETLREFKTGNIEIKNPNILIWSGILLLACIGFNFISQITGLHANKNERKYIDEELCKMEGENYDKEKQNEYDCNTTFYNKCTNFLNVSSVLLMFMGLIFLVIFNYYLI